YMNGKEIFRHAVRAVVESSLAALERAGLTPADVDVFVPHQANARIITAAADRLGIPPERCVVTIDRYGNTSSASIPLALADALDTGALVPGSIALLSGFGGGMTWASAVLRWGG
ncbi:MAG TPA: 3-oxoacyl-[acyl-carrier-protein] synthase III C-terminal domain-containing protein, partial [Acidimicrobiales bacterium]|nr:3-oxoacyl-[acyl-carrier-protein] synthase III C-terminal domain-containing protein [Acidimicrobiales bacterium]